MFCVSLRRVHQTHHSIQLTVPHTPRALINYDFSMFGGLNMDHISPWRFRLVDQQPASGLLDLGILVPSSAILPLAMLEPKYSMVSRLLCSLCALSVSPNRSPCSNYPAQLRIVMVLDQNSPTACMERRPVVFTVPLERRPKNTYHSRRSTVTPKQSGAARRRGRCCSSRRTSLDVLARERPCHDATAGRADAVSYTHLTLPTKRIV